jgi:hypothetical protein
LNEEAHGLYGEEDQRRAQEGWNRAAFIACAIGAAALALSIIGLVIRIKWLAVTAAAVGGCAVYGWIALKLMPWSAYRAFLREMAEGLTRTTQGTLVRFDDQIRFVDGVGVRDMLLDDGGGTDLLFYWDIEKTWPGFEAGQRLKLISFGKFVTSIEGAAAEGG